MNSISENELFPNEKYCENCRVNIKFCLCRKLTKVDDNPYPNEPTEYDKTLKEWIKKDLEDLDAPTEDEEYQAVDHPEHYQGNKYECIDIIEDYNLNFNLGNAIKYILRSDKKGNKRQDLEKAIWYLNREMER